VSRLFLATSVLCLFLLALSAASAQTNNQARKFDEFGDIQYSDLIARLDNFAIQLQNEPSSKGFILVYRTRRDLPGLSNRLALWSKDYMINSRGLPKDRVVTVDAGAAGSLAQELWIVPPGAAPTPRPDAYQRNIVDTDSARKFDEYGFLPREQYGDPARRFSLDSDGEHLEAFVTELRKERSSAYIIAYAQYNPRPMLVDYAGNYEPKMDVRLDRPGTARRRLSIEKWYLMKSYGFPASRIKLIDGGYRKRRGVELWIVPRGEHAPIPTPNSFPPKRARRRK
jgi:hypothetical protein